MYMLNSVNFCILLILFSLFPVISRGSVCIEYYTTLTEEECTEMEEIKSNYKNYSNSEKDLANLRINEIKSKLIPVQERSEMFVASINAGNFSIPSVILEEVINRWKSYTTLPFDVQIELAKNSQGSGDGVTGLGEGAKLYLNNSANFLKEYMEPSQ